MRKPVRLLVRLLLALVVLVIIAIAGAWLTVRGSLARLDGEVAVAGLQGKATVTRDALGVASIEAGSRRDASFALGYVHAQERFFAMDLMRRSAAGELAELVAAALPGDRQRRAYRMRARATEALARMDAAQRADLDAYRDGVNAGLAALGSRPFEYWVLGSQPAPWRSEDSMLVLDAMFFELNDATNGRELAFAKMKAALPASVFAFLRYGGGPWDAPLTGPPMPAPTLPPASDIDLSKLDATLLQSADAGQPEMDFVGSNSFAVGGALTANHAAMVANDMHLTLRVPNIWFRARLVYPNPRHAGDRIDLVGVTLPGLPSLVAGSNHHVAWAFTNSYGDWTDWVRVLPDPADRRRYRNASGSAAVEMHHEVIKVHGAPDDTLDVTETEWGPILADDADGTPLALAWTALRPGGVNLELMQLDVAETVDEAMDTVNRAGMPVQNFVVGDRSGSIGWTLAGRLPRRAGHDDAQLPAEWLTADSGWQGWLEGAEVPRLPNPANSRLWTANARTLDFESAEFARLGDGGFDLGARARQIRDDLGARQEFAPADFLQIQLDDRALMLNSWHTLLHDVLARAKDDHAFDAMRAADDAWLGRATPDSVAYRVAREFRNEVSDTVMAGFGAAVRARYKDFKLPFLAQRENLVQTLLARRPAHLLPPGQASWDALLHDCAERVNRKLAAQPGGLAARSWGEINTMRIRHPLSAFIPGMGWLLDMPADRLGGDANMPRVQGAAFGASERFGVQPGHEEEGYFHMPGGQSGNPLSPFYGAGHEDWAQGRPAPFLPGATKYTLTLSPKA